MSLRAFFHAPLQFIPKALQQQLACREWAEFSVNNNHTYTVKNNMSQVDVSILISWNSYDINNMKMEPAHGVVFFSCRT